VLVNMSTIISVPTSTLPIWSGEMLHMALRVWHAVMMIELMSLRLPT